LIAFLLRAASKIRPVITGQVLLTVLFLGAAAVEGTISEVTSADLIRLRDVEHALVMDVRTPQEYEAGHIRGAVLIPIRTLKRSVSRLPFDKKRPIVVYCTAGVRSEKALRILEKNGFSRLYHDREGTDGWARSGRALTTDGSRPPPQ
jgi:phage shock protein E